MWNHEDRFVPEPKLEEIVPGVAWSLTINFYDREGSSLEREASSLALNGFGSNLVHDYLVLATQKALAYIKEHGLRLDSDYSTVAGVSMVVFRAIEPDVPTPRAYHQPVPHMRLKHAGPCALCGRNGWSHKDNCTAFLTAMGIPHDPDTGIVIDGTAATQAAA